MAQSKKDNIQFEKAIDRLSVIVEKLEDGDASLDESLKLFEEGASLVKTCNKQLEEAEQKIKKLSINSEGEYEESDFTDDEE